MLPNVTGLCRTFTDAAGPSRDVSKMSRRETGHIGRSVRRLTACGDCRAAAIRRAAPAGSLAGWIANTGRPSRTRPDGHQ